MNDSIVNIIGKKSQHFQLKDLTEFYSPILDFLYKPKSKTLTKVSCSARRPNLLENLRKCQARKNDYILHNVSWNTEQQSCSYLSPRDGDCKFLLQRQMSLIFVEISCCIQQSLWGSPKRKKSSHLLFLLNMCHCLSYSCHLDYSNV